MSRYVLSSMVMFASIFSTSALAQYKYVYIGNTFTATYNQNNFVFPDFFETQTEMVNQYISVSFLSPILLTGAINLSSHLPFTMSLIGNGEYLGYGYTEYYPSLFSPEFVPGYDFYPSFNIYAVDDQGLPIDWAISLGSVFHSPRINENYMGTSTHLDNIYGGYELASWYSGQLNNNPGLWTVMAVAEPEVYAMLLAALGLLGYASRRSCVRTPSIHALPSASQQALTFANPRYLA